VHATGGESKNMNQTRKARTSMSRYFASAVSWHAMNFVKGVLIGGVVVLLVGLMVA
jgi:type III secretory pathway component EscV